MRVLSLWNVSKEALYKPNYAFVAKHAKHSKAFVTTPIYYVNAGTIQFGFLQIMRIH